MSTEAVSFNTWIKRRRRALDLTQEDLAERVGCSTVTIQKIELGERRPSKQIALRLAEGLHIASDEHEAFVQFARGDESADQPFHPPHAGEQPLPAPARAAQSLPASNLPTPLTSLVGRIDALETACGYLLRPDIRLLTLTGVPGIGKTRLSLDVAARLIQEFTDGVFFVELASISEPELVSSAVVGALGGKDLEGASHSDWLKRYFRDRTALLVLDNFEQVLDAAPLVVELLGACADLKVMVTSREGLHIAGEQQFPVQPLGVPDLAHLPGPQDDRALPALLSFPSVELFLQRACAVDPGFVLGADNYSVVAAICARLEGLPLAIELAAARIELLTLADLFSHLDRRLKLLTGGPRHLPARLQTLRGAIDWSYRLLSQPEQQLFARLGVFSGGATLPAIQAICCPEEDLPDVLDRVGSLVKKSLLLRVGNTRAATMHNGKESRYSMLEAIREYAVEKLHESGEVEDIRRAHTLYFLDFAVRENNKMRGPEEVGGLDRLEEEHDNLRAALQRCLSREAGAEGVEVALRLAVLLGRLWYMRGYLSEGRERLAAVLSISSASDNVQELRNLRAWALQRVGNLAFMQADYRATRTALEEALNLFEETADKKGIAYTLKDLADTAREEGDYDTATAQFEQSLSVFRDLEDSTGTMMVLALMSNAEMRRELYIQAATHLEEALQIAKDRQDPGGVAFALSSLGEAMILQGDYAKATPLLVESLAIYRVLGGPWFIAALLGSFAWVSLRQGNLKSATSMLMESLALRKDLSDRGGVAWCLERLAEIETKVETGDPLRSSLLIGAAKALRDSSHTEVDIADRPDYERSMNAARSRLGEQAFANAVAKGEAMTFEEVATYALATWDLSEPEAPSPQIEASSV